MSVGKKILQVRQQSRKTQQEVSELTGLAVSYISRLENNRINPSVRTLSRIAEGLHVPLFAFFDQEDTLETGDACPVSLSGRCILDHVYSGRGRRAKLPVEAYSRKQLEILRLVNFLMHTGDKEIFNTLCTLVKSLMTMAESRGHAGKGR